MTEGAKSPPGRLDANSCSTAAVHGSASGRFCCKSRPRPMMWFGRFTWGGGVWPLTPTLSTQLLHYAIHGA
jgi:hypothetical protein